MRILFIHTRYKFKGGEDIVFEKELELMQNAGFSVHSLLFDNSKNTFLNFLFAPFNPFSFYSMLKKIRAVKPDLVHVHNWSFAASPSVFWAARLKGIPLVHTLHNFRILCPSATLSYNKQPYLCSVKSYFPWKGIFKGVFKKSILFTFWIAFTTRFNYLLNTWDKINLYIALTDTSKSIFVNSYLKLKPSKIKIKPNFTDSYPLIQKKKRKEYFLYVGRLSEEKGVDLLLEAFYNSSYNLKIIGDGPLKSIVELHADNYKNIQYLGYKEKYEVFIELSESSALIFPSICYETFGMSIIEAFSTGTAVIGSDIGSAQDLIDDTLNGLLFRSGDVEDLKNKISQWGNFDFGKKQLVYKNALSSFKNHYAADKNCNQLVKIYVELLNI